MNPSVIIFIVLIGSLVTIINCLMLILIISSMGRIEEGLKVLPKIMNTLSSVVSQYESIKEQNTRNHDKLNLIKDRQWAVCEHLNLKNIIENWEHGKV